MIDLDKQFLELDEANNIWRHPQFTVADVCQVTGATPKAVEHFVDPKRDMVRLSGNLANPGKGKRRIFTGGQVLMIKAAYTMNALGFPQRFSRVMSESVERRATSLATGLALEPDMVLITYPMTNGDWAVIPVYGDKAPARKLPVAFQMLDVDRLVSETKAQLEAIVDGLDFPTFDIPDIEPEPNPYGPASNFFRMWEKDEAGNWLLVGLTLDETREYMDLQGWKLDGDELGYVDRPRIFGDDLERSVSLADKHQLARAVLCGMEADD
ncbi:MAG: hypothetical protein JXR75_00970 [Rhodobacteraceae bacterium]|nr:hypothetical protein [Paracoccaceae bacterium]